MKHLEPEMTAEMHAELLGDEIPHDELMAMAVCADVRRGIDKHVSLKKHGITEKYYDDNIDRILHT